MSNMMRHSNGLRTVPRGLDIATGRDLSRLIVGMVDIGSTVSICPMMTRALLQRCLEALAMYFSDSAVALDVSVFNAARIWKVYGTLACKGDHLPERPHRLSRLLDVPSPVECVTRQQLEELAALLPAPAMSASRRGLGQGVLFDLPYWIASQGLPLVSEGPWQQSGYRWVLNPCPWNSAHTNKSAFIVQFASGAIAAGCHHNGCHGNNWHALRDLYEPGWQTRARSATLHISNNGHTAPPSMSLVPAATLEQAQQEEGALSPGQQAVRDATETAQQAAEALLQTLSTLADDAKEDAILDALPALAPLDTIRWMRLKRQLKAVVPALNMNDLAQARSELRHAATPQAPAPAGSAQAQIAAALAQEYAGQLAYETSRKAWMAYVNGLWTPIDTEYIQQRIASYMDALLHGNYSWYELSGVEHLLGRRLAQTLTLETPGWLPFRNGVLCLATMTLHSHRPDRPFLWQLPYAYDPHATCLKTQAWLHEAVGGAHDQVQVLRAYAKAVVTRRIDLQRYLETIGPGGTGKGTYTRLLQALVGSENTFATEIKHLEANRFELSNLRGKALLMITDAERYSGPVNALKAITGQDFVRMEEKFKAQRTEIAPVMVVVAANEPIQSADYTSGLVRRRLSMCFRHRPSSPRDLLSWKDGAWHGELAPEIPGVLNWVLALPDAQMEVLLLQTTDAVPSLTTTWAYALVDTNPLAEWANQALILDDRKDNQGKPLAVNVGRAHKLNHTNEYEHQDIWLYPNYRAWVDDTGGKPLSSRRFTGLLNDLFENQLRLEGVEHRDDNKGSRFFGIRFRTTRNKDEPLLITKHPPPVTDVTPPVTDEPRTSDGCDACDGFLFRLYGHLPTPCVSDHPPRGVGVSIEELSNNPSNTSHSSLVRGRSVTDMSPHVTEPRPEGCLAVGEWAWLLSADGIQQNSAPYLCISIEQGPDGHWYARFLETDTGWPLAHCARADPPVPAVSNADPLPEHGTPPDARSPRPEPVPMEACPQCHCTNLRVLGTYRKCPLCRWRGKVNGTTAIPLQAKQE
jgi:phage/plasmid-associated DNA primase